MRRERELIEAKVLRCPFEIGVRQIDAHGRSRAAHGCVDTGGRGVAEQIKKSGSRGTLADQPASEPLIKKQAGIEMMLKIDLKGEPALLDHEIARSEPTAAADAGRGGSSQTLAAYHQGRQSGAAASRAPQA